MKRAKISLKISELSKYQLWEMLIRLEGFRKIYVLDNSYAYLAI
jgi:hypothetical protein